MNANEIVRCKRVLVLTELLTLLTPANEVWDKVMFLLTSVILSTDGVRGLPLDSDPLDRDPPPGQRPPPPVMTSSGGPQ